MQTLMRVLSDLSYNVGIMTIFLAVCFGSFPTVNQSLQIWNLFKTLINDNGLEF